MPDIPALIQSGAANAWLLLPVAVVLGALHALEPGHAKSMMTAFIVAIHGTAAQATLLALSATVGHTIVVWVLAILAWQLQDTTVLEKAEPWLLLDRGGADRHPRVAHSVPSRTSCRRTSARARSPSRTCPCS